MMPHAVAGARTPRQRRPAWATAARLGLLAGSLLGLLAGSGRPAAAQRADTPREAHAEFLLGAAWSLRTPLVVRLPDVAPVRLRARYATRPWADAPYYAYRVGTGHADGCDRPPAGVEGELLHHKLYLENPVPPIDHFEVTHGYNFTSATAVRPAGRLAARFAASLVVAHAEGRVAGERVGGTRRTLLGGGYHVAGAAVQIALGRRYVLARGGAAALVGVPEAKLTAAFARVPVGDRGGVALVPNVAAHVLAGLGACRVWR